MPNFLVSILGETFGAVTTTKILLVLLITISYFSFKKLLDYLISEQQLNYIPSLLFAFSPFLLNEIIGGSWYMWISFALAPVYVYSLFKIVIEKKWRHLFLFILSSVFVISSLQNLACVLVITVSYLLYKGYVDRKIVEYLKRFVILQGILLTVNSYWLISFVITFAEFNRNVFTSQTFAGSFNGVRNSLQSVMSIMNITGYLDRNMYYYTVPEYLRQIFNIGIIASWLAIIYSFLFLKLKPVKKGAPAYLFWLLLFLLSAFIVKGGNVPLTEATMYVFYNFIPMRLFRSPQHLMFFPAFIVPVLVAYAATRYKTVGYRHTLSILLVLVLIWISGWFLNGDLGKETLMYQKKDRIDLFQLSPELQTLYKHDLTDPDYRRVVFLPAVASPFYRKTQYQSLAQGGIPEYLYLQNPTFTAESNVFANEFGRMFCGGDKFDFVAYLSYFGVRDIVMRDDIIPAFTDCANHYEAKKAIKAFESDRRITRTYASEYLRIYEIKKEFRQLPVYVPRRVVVSSARPETLPKAATDAAVLFKTQNPSVAGAKTISHLKNNSQSIEYKKIHPAKYIVRVKQADKPFPLILSTAFNSIWKVRLIKNPAPDSTGKYRSSQINGTVQNDNLPSGHWYDLYTNPVMIGEADHVVINGYANGWVVDPITICRDGACRKNTDGTYTFDLLIEFNLQQSHYIGAGITILLLVIIAGIYAFKATKKS